ncbi:trimethyllysine dioxygenase [Spizellomyces punctatus DAOM BR117]|uniref:Trimethyllysine dioxygenase n=1 Tax=Spizellomyces punctatus (strain DAOM BR117) TaxID=645134 RepID=A0A0L0HJP4_SPIPD|nr:trimethyllysine dioxygenase [Spizellomyces punctatus DAOM BR117]KND01253.1 trimethyllysine dioxygenase [Spizellomyces punctatus DAOM BR117]|eukprot:XP_016609292.1 trimethyllysine dioxygenase [Spizellomyces punctatus DAOM BR117]
MSLEVTPDGKQLRVSWLQEPHVSVFDLEWLRYNSYNPPLRKAKERPQLLWRADDLVQNLPVVPYAEVMEDDNLLKTCLLQIETFGISFIDGIPSTVEATDALARRITFVRETHYGQTHLISADLAHGDAAFMPVHLPAHADTCYFTDSVGLLMMHVLHHTGGTGGESTFVDGFAVAEHLKREHQWAYKVLTKVPVSFHSAGDEETLVEPIHASSILREHPLTGKLLQIRHNNEDRSVLREVDPHDVSAFYAALKLWTGLLKDPVFEYRIKMPRGCAAMVDNWRVLHGRTAFTGSRVIAASYLNRDDYKSRVKTLLDGNVSKRFL